MVAKGVYVHADRSDYGDDVKYDKVVRDGVVERLQKLGDAVEFETITDNSLVVVRLISKIHEEADEYLEASAEKKASELADILQLVHSIAGRDGLDMELVEDIREDKLAKAGGYDKGIILKRVVKGDSK